MATAMGRMLRKPNVRITAADGGVRIRVDDDANPEFWLELWCSAEELRAALGDARDDDNPYGAGEI